MRKILGMIGGVIGMLLVIWGIAMRTKENAAVSIIGGADGPTSIFVAAKLDESFICLILAVGVILIVAAVIMVLKKRR